VDVDFYRLNEDGDPTWAPGYFNSSVQTLNEADDCLDLDSVVANLLTAVENFNSRGSGYILSRITKAVVCMTVNQPLHGKSYIPTPGFIAAKRCCINVENKDNRCFMWAVLSCLYPAGKDAQRTTKYEQYVDTLEFGDIEFPMSVSKVPKFESLNPKVAVNVFFHEMENNEIIPLYVSPHRGRKVVRLLIVEGPRNTVHYMWIKNMSALVAHRTNHKGATFVCDYCLRPCSSADVLKSHIVYCSRNPPQQVHYPDPNNKDQCTLKFRETYKQFYLPFYLVADFEAFLTPTTGDTPSRIVNEHTPSGFCVYRVSDITEYNREPFVYSGPDVMNNFYDHIMSESEAISEILDRDCDMLPLTDDEQIKYDATETCPYNDCQFDPITNPKVRHHNHITGRFISAACNNCNLQLKMKKKSGWKKHNDDDDDEYDEDDATEQYVSSYFLPIIFHNGRNYDYNFVIKHFQRKYAEHIDPKTGNITINDIKVIPLNSQKYLMFEVGRLRFLDSFQFLSTSLSSLTDMLLKSGKQNFVHTMRHFATDDPLLFAKGVYPYSYMNSRERFAETHLPPREEFYNDLTEECLSEEDYERAQATWELFDIKNMEQYHNFYLKLDTLLLADVFNYFRDTMYAKHKLDCLHYYTLPQFSWSAALRYTKAEIDLLTDSEAYLMIESAMRGGISQISCRFAEANNKNVEGYNPEAETNYVTYLDANNLYGHAMSEPLPMGNFRFLTPEEIERFDVTQIPDDAPKGYIVECDLAYPIQLHNLHNDYPMAPEHRTVTHDMLSDYALSFGDQIPRPTKKLILSLYDKEMYVTHYRNLKFYITHGLQLTKIHRVLEFTQAPWLKPYIDLCTAERQKAATTFEADFHKLSANSCFGKTMENLRDRQNIRLIADRNKFIKAVSKPTYVNSEIINEDLVMVKGTRLKLMLNKPIFAGFTILELSKLTMYSFHYDYILPTYGPDRARLLFTDTDSLTYHIQTENLHDDMKEDLDRFDTSNFPKEHELFSMDNHRVVGKFKSETAEVAPKQFVGLRSKMYSLYVRDDKPCKTALKGIMKSYVKKHIRHQAFLKTLRSKKCTSAEFRAFRADNHVIKTVQISKICLSAFDDKRYILNDGMHSLAYGHHSLRSRLV